MNEIDQGLVMDARAWIEFGKMFNNMIVEGWEVDIESSVINDSTTTFGYFVYDPKTDSIYENSYFLSPYLAIKEVYFRFFLDQPNNVDVLLNLEKDIEDEMYLQADKLGITVDEFVVNVLKEQIEKVEERPVLTEYASCCFNCSHVKELEEISPYCSQLRQRTEREYTCRYFERYTPSE